MKKIFLALAFMALGLFAGLPAPASGELTNNGTPTTQPPSGDNTLIGTWSCYMLRMVSRYSGGSYTNVYEYFYDHYVFYDNGTFSYNLYRTPEFNYEGTYSISYGKLYLKNIVTRHIETNVILEETADTEKPDKEMEYEILTDEEGEYLHIGCLFDYRFVTTAGLSKADKYYRK
jgi:hypothetical protein